MARPPLETASPSPIAPAIVRWLAARGLDAATVLGGTGLSARDAERDETPMTALGLAALFDRVAEAAAEPNLGVRLPSELPFRSYDAATLAARAAATPRASLEAFARFGALVFPSLVARVDVERGGPSARDSLRFRAQIAGHPRGLGLHVDSFLVALALGLGRRGSESLVPSRVWLTSARRGDLRALTEALGTSDVTFGAEDLGFVVDLADSERAFATVDPLLGATAERLAEGALLGTARPGELAVAIDARIVAALPRVLEAEAVARTLGMSERTLQRRLEEEGTRFSSLVDRAREREARRRTRYTNASLVEIAAALGFSDGPTFSRAFKRWTGMPPGTYRRMT